MRISTLDAVFPIEESLLIDKGSIREVGVFLAGDGSLIEVPVPIALAYIHQGAIVGTEGHTALILRREGNLLGGIIFHRSHKHFATHGECHLLAIGRYGSRRGTACHTQILDFVHIVAGDINAHFLRFATYLLRIDLTVVSEAEVAVIGQRKEAHGMCAIVSHSLNLLWGIQGEGINIGTATVALAKDVHCLPVLAQHRIAVFACDVG